LPAVTAWALPGTVHLKNGGWIEGEVLEMLPGERVSIRGSDGTTRTIPWAEIERVDQAQAAPAAAPVAPQAASPEAPSAPAPAASTTDFKARPALANAPMSTSRGSDLELAPSGARYNAESLRDLEEQRSQIDISSPIALMAVGAVVAIAGAVLVVEGLAIESENDHLCAGDRSSCPRLDSTPFLVVGVVGIVLGGVSLAVGAPMLSSRIKDLRRDRRSFIRLPSDGPRLARAAPVFTLHF
jgi:hypothetical protein